jgi:glycosyltransferase involved in cell wall biosynthesis
MQKLYIVDPYASGHRMMYVRRIAREAIQRNISVTLVTMPKSLDHPSYKLLTAELGKDIRTECLTPSKWTANLIDHRNLLVRQFGYYRAISIFFNNLASDREPSFIFVPYLDDFDKATALLGSPFGATPYSALSMQYKFHYNKMGAQRPPSRDDIAKEWIFKRLLNNRKLRTLFTIDELLYDYAQKYLSNLCTKMTYVGDPVDMEGGCSKQDARTRYVIGEDSIVVLIYGVMDLRKGIGDLISAAAKPMFPQKVVLLFVGRQETATKEFLSTADAAKRLRSEGRLIEVDRYVDDEEEYAAFSASDIVWVGYRAFYGMSGVLVQAGKMNLPVISSTIGLIGWLVQKYQLGLAIDTKDTASVVQCISSLVQDVEARRRLGYNGGVFAKRHTSQEFANTIMDKLLQ